MPIKSYFKPNEQIEQNLTDNTQNPEFHPLDIKKQKALNVLTLDPFLSKKNPC